MSHSPQTGIASVRHSCSWWGFLSDGVINVTLILTPISPSGSAENLPLQHGLSSQIMEMTQFSLYTLCGNQHPWCYDNVPPHYLFRSPVECQRRRVCRWRLGTCLIKTKSCVHLPCYWLASDLVIRNHFWHTGGTRRNHGVR